MTRAGPGGGWPACLPVTSVARSAVDVARGRSIDDAVVVLDSAARVLAVRAGVDLRRLRDDPHLRASSAEHARAELWAAYRAVRRWPFTVVVRSSIPLLDPASESPLESRSRVRILRSDVPAPRIAVPVVGASGTTYYADFVWDEWKVIGEADGSAKYGRTRRPSAPGSAPNVVVNATSRMPAGRSPAGSRRSPAARCSHGSAGSSAAVAG